MNREPCSPISDEISEHVAHLFKGLGMKQEEACKYAGEVSDLLLKLYAGQMVHFPARRWKEIKERNAQITDQFNGQNAPYLAGKFGLTLRSIWRIIRKGTSNSRAGL